MKIAVFEFNPIEEKTYVVYDNTGEAAVIDAGNFSRAEDKMLERFFEENCLRPVLALNTHGHFDHLLGVKHLQRKYGVSFALHGGDRFLVDSLLEQGKIFGVRIEAVPDTDIDLKGRESISFGNTELGIIHTPGHTPGHICLYCEADRLLFTGDTLFRESIGRTDLPGGDYSWIMESIIDKILPLGDDVAIFPGHGPKSTIGHEILCNPFISEVLREEVNYRGGL